MDHWQILTGTNWWLHVFCFMICLRIMPATKNMSLFSRNCPKLIARFFLSFVKRRWKRKVTQWAKWGGLRNNRLLEMFIFCWFCKKALSSCLAIAASQVQHTVLFTRNAFCDGHVGRFFESLSLKLGQEDVVFCFFLGDSCYLTTSQFFSC